MTGQIEKIKKEVLDELGFMISNEREAKIFFEIRDLTLQKTICSIFKSLETWVKIGKLTENEFNELKKKWGVEDE